MRQRPFAGVVHIARCFFQTVIVQFGQAYLIFLEGEFSNTYLCCLVMHPGGAHHHRQNHVAVFAANVNITQTIVGDRPDKGNEFVVCCVVHALVLLVQFVKTYPYLTCAPAGKAFGFSNFGKFIAWSELGTGYTVKRQVIS